jgi:hypothetical protein
MIQKPVVTPSEAASARDGQASSLLPMLVAGLLLAAIGGAVIMMFV